MFGHPVKFECLNMRKRFRFNKPRDRFQAGSRTRADDHVGAAQQTLGSIGESNFYSSRRDEPTGPSQNQYRSGVSVAFKVHVVETGHHLALALADIRHLDCEVVVSDAKLCASANVGCDLRAVDDVLARETRDVRARSANIFAVDYNDVFSFASKRPRSNGRT